MPVDTMSVTFLGTAAGRPCATRNVSSLVVKLDSRLWMVDAGEGTQHRLLDARCKRLAMSKVARIFVTHMHADHVNGLPGLLATISAADSNATADADPLEIYGPSGLRQFLRCTLSLTQTILARPYRVHELLFPDEEGDHSSEKDLHPSERLGQDLRADGHGFWRNFVSEDGVTVSAGPILHTIRCFGYLFDESPRTLPIEPARYIPHLKNPINRAGLLQSHGLTNPLSLLSRFQANPDEEVRLADGTVLRAPGLDFKNGGRRIVILGDTYDASALVPLIRGADLGACDEAARRVDVVVHESTNAYLPTLDESQSPLKTTKGSHEGSADSDNSPLHSLESVTTLAQSHGHSTPQVAGRFARSIQAQRLVLNHLSVKYPDPEAREALGGDSDTTSREKWARMLREIERQAVQAFRGITETDADLRAVDAQGSVQVKGEEGTAAVMAARDFLEIEISRRDKLARGGKSK